MTNLTDAERAVLLDILNQYDLDPGSVYSEDEVRAFNSGRDKLTLESARAIDA
jgi:hypothetical protein